MKAFATGTHTIDTTEWSLTNNSAVIAAQTAKGRVAIIIDIGAALPTNYYVYTPYEKALPGSGQYPATTGDGFYGTSDVPMVIQRDHPGFGNGWDITLQMQDGGTPAPISWTIWIDEEADIIAATTALASAISGLNNLSKQNVADAMTDQMVNDGGEEPFSVFGLLKGRIFDVEQTLAIASGIGLVVAASSNTIDVSGIMVGSNYYAGCILVVQDVTVFESRMIQSSGAVGGNTRLTVSEPFNQAIQTGESSKFYILSLGRAQVMNKVDLVDAPNTAAIQAFYDLLTSAKSWTTGSFGKLLVDNLNAKVGDVAAAAATAVWGATTRTLSAATNITADIAAAVWNALTSGLTTTGSIGKLLVTNVNATISGVSASVWTVGTRTLTAATNLSTDIADAVWEAFTNLIKIMTNWPGLVFSGDLLATDAGYDLGALIDDPTTFSPPQDWLVGQTMTVMSGPAQGQSRIITANAPNAITWSPALNPPPDMLETYSVHITLPQFELTAANFAAIAWAYSTRVLTAATNITAGIASACATAVWAAGTRTLTSLGTLIDAITTTINGINAKTTNLPAAPASTGDVTTSQGIITAAIAALHNLAASDVLTQAGTALTNYGAATASNVTATQSAITNAISALNNLSAAQARTQVDNALTAYAGPTKTDLTTTQTAITNAIAALHNLSASDVLTQVGMGLTNYTAATAAEITAAQAALTLLIGALNNLSPVQAQAAVAAALAAYNAAKVTDVHTYESEDITA